MDLDVPTPEAMQRLGAAIGRLAQPGDLFLLDGRFGAGKTTFVQGLAQGLGVEAAVTSPSFVLENQYEGRLTLYHVDLYRLEQLSPAFLAELEEHLFGDGVAAVEWPQLLPSDVWGAATVIRFEAAGGGVRRVHLGSPDERWQRLTLDESV